MFQKNFIVFSLVAFFAGCATLPNAATGAVKLTSSTSEPRLSGSEQDKVWIEAETKKVWVNSYVDENGDMVEGHYKHIIVIPGHWAVKDGGKE